MTPNKRDELLALALRVEQATGALRILDTSIWDIVRGAVTPWGDFAGPDYTASLDAAMTLVPEGWYWHGGTGGRCDSAADQSWMTLQDQRFGFANVVESAAATSALALTAAALRAIAHKEPTT